MNSEQHKHIFNFWWLIISNLFHKHKKTPICAEVKRQLENVSFAEKQSFERVILIFNGCMNEQNSSFYGPPPKKLKHQIPNSNTVNGRTGLTWWECLAVFQYVILECAGCAGCQAVECVHVCVTDECESVSKSTRWLKRAMWLPVVSWRALLWWKVICFPEERPVPSFLPLLRHRPSTPTPAPWGPF